MGVCGEKNSCGIEHVITPFLKCESVTIKSSLNEHINQLRKKMKE
jgi:hypothetical protein